MHKHTPTKCSSCHTERAVEAHIAILEAEAYVSSTESFAQQHADQWLGCVACKVSHHTTNFCSCGVCYFRSPHERRGDYDIVTCTGCGQDRLWD